MNDPSFQTSAIVKFVVDTDGLVKNIGIYEKGQRKEHNKFSVFEKELVKALKKTPKWIPTRCGDKYVPQQINIKFTI